MSGADHWPVDAAALRRAFRVTDAAWESAVEAADAAMLYEAAAATTASAALAEEAARYEEEYTAEYGEQADLEALYEAAARAKVAAWAARGAVKAMTASEEAEEEASTWGVVGVDKDDVAARADLLAEMDEAWAAYAGEDAVEVSADRIYADLLAEEEWAMDEESERWYEALEDAAQEAVDAVRAAVVAWAAASRAAQRITTLEYGPGSSPDGC